LQSNGHSFFIPQVHASSAANQGGAETDGAVGASKVAHLIYTCSRAQAVAESIRRGEIIP
jgi:hypothetical protein